MLRIMACEVAKFEVVPEKHPSRLRAIHYGNYPKWLIRIYVKFKSDDPKDWGEFRAYGAFWCRRVNRKYQPLYKTGGKLTSDPTLKSSPSKTEFYANFSDNTGFPVWEGEGPKGEGNIPRLGRDQHMEIFYAQPVPKVPRSDPKSKLLLYDDDNTPDDIHSHETRRPHEIDLRMWHIVARDEPIAEGTFQMGDWIHYEHQAEYSIRVPGTVQIVARRRLCCRVLGHFPDYEYHFFKDGYWDKD
jgi:hypothetical protein